MYEVSKSFLFDAGHVLTNHNGLCKRPHGHTYTLTVTVRSSTLKTEGSSSNMVVDFKDISEVVKPMLMDYFDHHWLNETLETESPTVEYITKWIYDYLKPFISGLYSITLHETPTSKATYWEED
ncbi:MAG: 6-carboxy-5,6,7,8-tetrahydropterin synthase [Chlamydiae bacterium]|nr:6-carboxy-5,6,7,8-tetrahydropterin synthase [Chlamydiota bacterium]